MPRKHFLFHGPCKTGSLFHGFLPFVRDLIDNQSVAFQSTLLHQHSWYSDARVTSAYHVKILIQKRSWKHLINTPIWLVTCCQPIRLLTIKPQIDIASVILNDFYCMTHAAWAEQYACYIPYVMTDVVWP